MTGKHVKACIVAAILRALDRSDKGNFKRVCCCAPFLMALKWHFNGFCEFHRRILIDMGYLPKSTPKSA